MSIIARVLKILGNPVVWILYFSTIVSFLFFLYGIDSWKFAFAGDDWAFYDFALRVIGKHFWLNPFSFAGVYHQNSVLTSMYQALLLMVFDKSVISWRLSNSILIVPSSLLFYFFVRLYFGRLTALLSTLLMQYSFYLANFFKIGYINPQALPLFLLCLLLSALLGVRPSKKKALCLGLALGVSFYVYIGPIFPFIVWPYLLPLWQGVKRKKIWVLLSMCLLGYVVVLLPLLPQIGTMIGPMHKTTMASQESLKISVPLNIFHNFLLFYKDFQTYRNHFVTGPYVDVVTRVFLTIGFVISMVCFKKRAYSLLLLAYVSMVVMQGIINVYPTPPVTRGFLFLPFGFVFAGIGLSFFYRLIRSKFFTTLFLALVFFWVLVINVYRSQIGVFQDAGYTTTALLLKSVQEADVNGKGILLFILSEPDSYNGYLGWFQMVERAYGFGGVQIYVLRPVGASCKYLWGRKLVVLKSDSQAVHWVKGNVCGKRYGYSVLEPKIPYY